MTLSAARIQRSCGGSTSALLATATSTISCDEFGRGPDPPGQFSSTTIAVRLAAANAIENYGEKLVVNVNPLLFTETGLDDRATAIRK